MPFFTPIWDGIPVFMLIFQLAREVWWYEAPAPLSLVGFVREPLYLRLYRRIPAFTISDSTRSDLAAMDFHGPVTVLPVAAGDVPESSEPKTQEPTFIYVGRIAPSKRIA